MTIQTIEIHGERYVLLSERDFLALRGNASGSSAAPPPPPAPPPAGDPARFREVTPLRVGGAPASELLMRDRR